MWKASLYALVAILALGGMAVEGTADAGAPANTLADMFANLKSCLATVRLEPGTEVTVRFMLNRRGGVIGKPSLTYAHWAGDEEARKRSAASVAEGFDRCLPLSITDQLGGAIAGRLMSFRLRGAAGREQKI